MDYELRISPQALEEINQAFDYYYKISEEVAFNFHEELEKVLDTLEFNPHFQIRYREVRAIPFYIFPYLVFIQLKIKSFTFILFSTPLKIRINIRLVKFKTKPSCFSARCIIFATRLSYGEVQVL